MTKIKNTESYPLKIPVATDTIVGSDSENDGKTVSFQFDSFVDFVNSINGNEVISYTFATSPVPDLDENGDGFFLSKDNVVEPGTITELKFSKKTKSGIDITLFFNFIDTHKNTFTVHLRNLSNPNNFVYLNILEITEDDFQFLIQVSAYASDVYLGNLIDKNIYVLEFNIKADTDVLGKTLDGLDTSISGPITMSYTVIQAFGSLQNQYNQINTVVSGKLDKGSYSGTAENLKSDIDNIYQPNTLISSVSPTRSVNTFTFPVNQYTVLINKTIRTNPAQFVTTIDVATTDYKRVDLIWFKDDNTLQKTVGTESITVAQRPDIPSGQTGVPISFINVFGNIISDPTPITQDISIQNSFGAESFKVSDYMRFKGATLYANEKLVEIDPLSASTVYISSVGDDTMAELENGKKPFKTLDKAIELIKTRQVFGINWRIVFLTDGIFEVNNYGSLAWWVETELNVTIVFKYAISRMVTYSILKGNNLKIISAPNVVANAFSNINCESECVIDWDFNTLEIQAVASGQPAVNRIIYFETPFIKLFRIRAISVTGNNTAPIISINAPIVDYVIQISNHNSSTGLSSIGSLFVLSDHTVQNSSITILNSNTKMSFIPFGAYAPVGVLIRIGNLLSTGYILLTAYNIAFINGTVQNLVIKGANYLTGKANITYNLNYPSSFPKIDLYGTNRNQGITCFWTDLDLTFIEGLDPQSSAVGLVNMYDSNPGLELKNVSIKVPTPSWNPDIFMFIISSGTLGQALEFRGDCDFDTGGAIVGYRNGPFGDDTGSVDLSTVTEAKNRGVLILKSGSISTRYDFEITDEKKESIDYPNDRKAITIRTQTKNLLVNRNIDPTNSFIVEQTLTLTAGQYITIPSGGGTINGNGVTVSKIVKNVSGESIFKSAMGGCGDIFIKDITIDSGIGKVFDTKDIDGTHAIELNDVNFENCSSLGTWDNFRQFTGTTLGFYNCLDGITIDGAWSGFKITNSNIINFGASGTIFKKGSTTLFSNRFYADLNIQVLSGAKICDFMDTNFANDKSLQVVNCYTKVNGVVNDALTNVLFPNITPYNSKSYFINNIGIKNSNNMPYGISTSNMQTYANDTEAATGGIVQVGDTYIETSTGYFKKRLT